VRLLSFPAYETAIGEEIGRALRGLREYSSEVMQLLYVANRYEHKTLIDSERRRGTILVCDRYLASSVAYGEAQGLDAGWLIDMQTEASATAGPDVPARHRSRGLGTSQGRGSRSLRARSGAARPGARELSPTGASVRVAGARRQSRSRSRCR
jgi:hypothetical protein